MSRVDAFAFAKAHQLNAATAKVTHHTCRIGYRRQNAVTGQCSLLAPAQNLYFETAFRLQAIDKGRAV